MERLIVEIESHAKAKELQAVLTDLKFVKQVTIIPKIADTPAFAFENEDEFFEEIERRTQELESGAIKGVTIDELEAGAEKIVRRRA